MGLKRKQARQRQKEFLEGRLKDRLAYLSGKGIASARVDKDPLIKKLRGDIRAVNNRLKVIADSEKRTEELSKAKAAKAAAPPIEKDEAGAKAEKPKKTSEAAKEKKPKAEKKPAAPKAPKPEAKAPEGGAA